LPQEAGIIDSDTATTFRQARYSHLQAELEAAESYQPVDPWSYQPPAATAGQETNKPTGVVREWSDLFWPTDARTIVNPDTGVEREFLIEVGKRSVSVPDGFVGIIWIAMTRDFNTDIIYRAKAMHDRLKRHVGARLKTLESGDGINWGTAEVRQVPNCP
jgi:probable 2-oxoglutarate dehydrogenase E1 component DHKTD1